MNVLITGGTGFIGSHLAKALEDQNVTLYSIEKGLDILNREVLQKTMKEQDIVFHLAAETNINAKSVRIFDVNTKGTLNVLNSVMNSNVKRMIFASSAAVYGNIETKCSEDMACEPISVYGASKLASENYINAYSESYGISAVSLRFFNVYGMRGHSVVNKFLENIFKGEKLDVFGDGTKSRDYIHVNDVVRASLIAMKSKLKGVFNIGTGISTSVNDLIETISQIIGKDIEMRNHDSIQGDIDFSCADTIKSEKILGFRSEIDLKQGISELVKYYS